MNNTPFNPIPISRLLTTHQIAPLFNVTPSTIRLWALRGWIIGKRIGRSWYFTQDAVNALMEVRS